MTINGKSLIIVNSAVSYESGISWKSANKHTEAIDYGIGTDHLSAKISVWGTVAEITEFRNEMPNVSDVLEATFSKGEKPFGPAFDCEDGYEYLLTGIDDMATTGKGIAQMSFQIAALWENPELAPKWAYDAIEFSLANFAVQEVRRESEESKFVSQKESGWSAFRHGWSRPEFKLSLLANSQVMGGTIRWLLTKGRRTPFQVSCNDSMALVDSQNEQSALLLSFGNLRRFGNSGMWQADFDFARAVV
ncbi:MAG: hypothetical protein LBQ76_04815 [Candidatus Fibromonas sp.]|jgi:hypothetical protein|nr:hypothetical protein [Candidatus Fibromonas sp.]